MLVAVAIAAALVAGPPPQGPDARAAHRGPLTLSAVGDLIFGWYTANGYTPLSDATVFDAVRPLLVGDVVLGNLETPVRRELPPRSPLARGWRFAARPEALTWTHDAGFTALSIANNHAIDLSGAGLRETAQLVTAAGMTPLGRPSADGAVRIDTIEVEGWTVAVVAATTWLNAPVPAGGPSPPVVSSKRLTQRIAPIVKTAAEHHDLVIVSLHWGREYTDAPNGRQRFVARALAEAGADLIWGHHPHVLQGVEWIGDALVAYSLGNFVFRAVEGTRARQSAVLRLTRAPSGRWTDVTMVPVHIEGSSRLQPQPAGEPQTRAIRRSLRRLSRRYGTKTALLDDGGLRIVLPEF